MNTKHLLRKLPSCLLGAIFAAGIASTTMVNAVDGDPPGLFQLDGDPNSGFSFGMAPPLAGDDWETLWGDCPQDPTDETSGFDPFVCGDAEVFTGIIPDFFGTGAGSGNDTSTFTGGGSKDPEDISPDGITGKNWLHTTGTNQDKNEINNGFAAAYLVPADVCYDEEVGEGGDVVDCGDQDAVLVHEEGDLVVYFGMDRFSNDGDAYAGFWFLQDNVSLTDTSSQGGLLFDGVHTEGDVLVLARFPQNSTGIPIIEVLEWTGDSNGTLISKFSSNQAKCDGDGNKHACAITNAKLGDNPNPPQVWPYTPKSNIAVAGDPPLYPHETFISGGINVTQLLGGQDVCFSTFLAETRASKTFSETATLSDFVLGSFPLCSVAARTEVHHADDRVPSLIVDGANPNNQLLQVIVGDEIQDRVFLTGDSLGGTAPDPSSPAKVTFTLYANGTCDGTEPLDVLQTSMKDLVPTGGGTARATSDNFTLLDPGTYSYQAVWPGDDVDGGAGFYPNGATADCEPFEVIEPKLTIRKEIISCDDDGGLFAVSVDGTTAFNATLGDPTIASLIDGDIEGPHGLAPGTYTVSEEVQDEYVAVFDGLLSVDCAETDPKIDGEQSVTLAGNDDKTCVFLNVRKPQVTVIKVIDGTAGTFDLRVDGDKVNTTDPLQGSTLIDTYANGNFGTPTVSEVATGTTSLENYSTIIQCNDGTSDAWDMDDPAERSVTLGTLAPGDDVICTITNISPVGAKACLSD